MEGLKLYDDVSAFKKGFRETFIRDYSFNAQMQVYEIGNIVDEDLLRTIKWTTFRDFRANYSFKTLEESLRELKDISNEPS